MKKIILIIVLNFYFLPGYGQYQWAKHVGSITDPENSRVISDGANAYLIGSYRGALYLPNDTLYSNGYNDIFIAKFDANGNELWARTLGGAFNLSIDSETAIGTFDPVNNCIYIAGSFINNIYFGGSLNLISVTNSKDIFIARMELDGTFTWANKAGGVSSDYVEDIKVSPSGKIYMVTQTEDSAFFDNIHLGAGGAIIQYDAMGILLSAELKFTAPNLSSSNVFINFIESDLILYGAYKVLPFQIDTATLITNGDDDAFLARADSMGHIKWVRHFGGLGADRIQRLIIDVNQNILFIGNYTDSIDLGGIPLVDSSSDVFIAKYDEDGNAIWAKKMGITGSIAFSGVIVNDNDMENGCYFTGSFSGAASFGSYSVSTANARDMFLTRYDSSGNCYGVVHFGETFSYITLAKDNSGSLFVNGCFANTVNIGSTALTSYGGYDIFLTKMDEITNIERTSGTSNNQLNIYANPNKGICNIIVPADLMQEKNLVLTIYNSTGKVIQQQPVQMQQQKLKINIAAEAAGIYAVTLGNSNKLYSGKIIFE